MWHSYDYSYYSGFDWEYFWSVSIGSLAVTGVISLVFYIFQSLGLYTIAKRRQVAHAWTAWVPLANIWLLGKISDQYQGYAQGRKTRRAAILLGCSIALLAVMIPFFVIVFSIVSQMPGWVQESHSWGSYSYRWVGEPPVGLAIATVVVTLVMAVVAIVAAVFQYIALYDLFRSCEPRNATGFLLISIFVNVAMPFLVFAVRKKDEGMLTPAQRQQAWQAQQAWYAQQWQAQQAWQAQQQWQAQQAWQAQQQWQAQQAQQDPHNDPFRQ